MKILIVGAGDIGFELSKRLSQEKHDITIVESDPRKVRRASQQLDALMIDGHGTSFQTLQKAIRAEIDSGLLGNHPASKVSEGRDKKRKSLLGVSSSASGVVRMQKTVLVPDLVGSQGAHCSAQKEFGFE